jgi:hypothetical protein
MMRILSPRSVWTTTSNLPRGRRGRRAGRNGFAYVPGRAEGGTSKLRRMKDELRRRDGGRMSKVGFVAWNTQQIRANAEHRSRFVDSCALLAGGARSDYCRRRGSALARAGAMAGTRHGARVSIAPERAKPVSHEFVLGQSASGSRSRLPYVRCADGEALCPTRPAR